MIFFSNDLHAKSDQNIQTAVIAGGCFWGIEELFRNLDGILETQVGYAGGTTENPSYESVSTGLTGHAESVKITFDENKISYEKILKFFFTIHDPTQLNRQQNDIGTQYRSEIFYTNSNQKNIAELVIQKAEKLKIHKAKIQTKISPLKKFYKAENYHQNYLQKNPNGYTCHYVRNEWQF
ncbi:MAG: peptide-methionine (S)-S-oxide reductase [Proteobacteria bacterium]|nr:peptide-methionine (S)-S-oxide reductase [Pseudomonadota bacterium]NCA28556.1 peptide-methionine (S)-S-oxide reductase [Pseudomonadota bacterium]